MSFEPDTNDNRIRQLKEEIAKIREEKFFQLPPINDVGSSSTVGGSSATPLPNVGTSASTPQTISVTLDNSTVEKLNYKNLITEFTIGETITGGTSGAKAVIGDIDITGTTTGILTLLVNTLVGSFVSNEVITGSVSGDGKAVAQEYVTVGRGHLNARATSIIADGYASTFDLHYLDGAIANGQTIYLRPKTGQIMRVRRAITSDGLTGNIDTDFTFTIDDNQLVLLQFQRESNVTPNGGWIVLFGGGTGGTISTTLAGIDFPILYPKEDLMNQSGVVNLSLNQSDGHYKRIRMVGDISLTFSNPPPSTNGFKFYVLLEQDGIGSRNLTAVPSSVKNGATLLDQIDSVATSQTLLQFVTADGGTTYHAQIIKPTGSVVDTPWDRNHNANSFDLFNVDKLLFFSAGGFNFPFDANLKGISTSGTGLEFNVPSGGFASYRYYIGGVEEFAFGTNGLDMFNNGITRLLTAEFVGLGGYSAFIFSDTFNSSLSYNVVGGGANHAFYVDSGVNANMEIRLNLNKSNVNLDMVTNDITNLDQAQFDPFGGFSPTTQHGDRRISGGNSGININIPNPPGPFKTLKIWFENAGQTDSDVEYEFRGDSLDMHQNIVSNTLGVFFTNGHHIADFPTHLEYSATIGTVHQFKIGSGSAILEINNTEIGSQQGFIKLFADMNVQTQNINQVDRMSFVSNNGLVGGNQFAIAGDFPVGRGFQFNIPLLKQFRFSVNDEPIMHLSKGLLDMRPTVVEPDPAIVSHQYALADHSQGTFGMGDGTFRSVDNGPNSDVWVATGGVLKNLSTLGSTSFIGFMADADLNMNTLNIFNLDVLRFAVDSGVIGFGEYGTAVEAGGSKLKWSVPAGKSYEWQVNLNPIASLNSASFHMSTNASVPSPSIIADGSFIIGLNHISGVTGMDDGYFRTVQNGVVRDVIIRTGGLNVNLSTLVSGGSASLWANFPAVNNVNLNSNEILNFNVLRSTTNKAIDSVSGGWEYQTANTTEHQFQVRNAGNTAFIDVGKFTNTGFDAQGFNIVGLNALTFDNLGVAISQTATDMTFGVPSGNFIFSIGGAEYTMSSTALGMIGNNINDIGHIRFDEIADPPFLTNSAFLYGKDDAGITKLFMRWSDGTITELGGGGVAGSFVTTNTNQTSLSGDKTWTGIHTFSGSTTNINSTTTNINSTNINIGNAVTDQIAVAGHFVTNLLPFLDGGVSLGTQLLSWNSLWLSQKGHSALTIAGDTPDTLTTKNYIDNLVSGSSFVTTNTTQSSLSGNKTWDGIHVFNDTVGFTGTPVFVNFSISPQAINSTNNTSTGAVTVFGTQTITGAKTFNQPTFFIGGNLDQNGTSIGFRGLSPKTIVSVPSAFTLANWIILRNALIGMGIISA